MSASFTNFPIPTNPFVDFEWPAYGTSSRTAPARWGDFVNVKEFGAVGDGNTDDTDAIQAAIDSLTDGIYESLRRRAIYMPSGNYVITRPIYIDWPNNLRGSEADWASSTSYSIGDLVTYNGICWESQENANLDNAPYLPAKVIANETYDLGDIVEYKDLYWIALQQDANGDDLITLDPAFWSQTTIWWLPTVVTPTIFGFSITLYGDPGLSTDVLGTNISPTFNNVPAVWVGPGNGMMVESIYIQGPYADGSEAYGYRGGQPINGVGWAISGGSAGASRVQFINCGVKSFYTGWKTGMVNGALDDSNTWWKCFSTNCYIGVDIGSTQNFINSLYDCNLTFGTIGLQAIVGTGANVFGGNYSATNGVSAAFTIGSISALTATAAGPGFDYTFTAVVTAPDDYLLTEVYNSFCIETDHFGVIPMTMTDFDSGTNTATFQMWNNWSVFYFPASNAVTTSDLEAEVQAATQVFCAERVTAFWGNGLIIDGVHIENPSAPCTLIHAGIGFGTNRPVSIRNVYMNNDPALPGARPSTSPTDADLAKYYAAVTFPFIVIENSDVSIQSSTLGCETDAITVDYLGDGASVYQFNMTNDVVRFIANIRMQGVGFVGNGSTYPMNTPSLGGGEYQKNIMASNPATAADAFRTSGWGRSKFWGVRPAAETTPIVTPAQVVILTGTLPAISSTSVAASVSYPLLWGGQQYKKYDWYMTAPTNYMLCSDHHFYSMGQNLTTTNVSNLAWLYKGQSFAVYANEACLRLVFPGMQVKLSNTITDVLYIVTGVFLGLGYFTVAGAQSATDTSRLSGNKVTTFNGTSIPQEPFVITQF